MRADVREQVVDDLPETVAVAEDRDRLVGEVERPVGIEGSRHVDRIPHERVELDTLALEGASLVEAREQEQVLDEDAHPLGLARDAAHRPCEILRPALGSAPEELRVRPHGGEGRAQLVRRVCDEPPQPPVGCLDATEHRVERRADAADLRALVVDLDPVREVAGGDRLRGLLDGAQRPQSEAHDPEPEGRHRAEHRERDEQLDEEEAVERVVLAPERSGDEQDVVRMVALDRRAHAIAAAARRRAGP